MQRKTATSTRKREVAGRVTTMATGVQSTGQPVNHARRCRAWSRSGGTASEAICKAAVSTTFNDPVGLAAVVLAVVEVLVVVALVVVGSAVAAADVK